MATILGRKSTGDGSVLVDFTGDYNLGFCSCVHGCTHKDEEEVEEDRVCI